MGTDFDTNVSRNRIEGLWDCTFCDSKGIKAHMESCPNCGRTRDIDTVFYLPDNIEQAILTDEEESKTTDRPDWLCEYCGDYNRDDVYKCKGCGADRSESKKHYGIIHKLTGQLFNKPE